MFWKTKHLVAYVRTASNEKLELMIREIIVTDENYELDREYQIIKRELCRRQRLEKANGN